MRFFQKAKQNMMVITFVISVCVVITFGIIGHYARNTKRQKQFMPQVNNKIEASSDTINHLLQFESSKKYLYNESHLMSPDIDGL